MTHVFDVAIIGAGPGGYVGAIRAQQLGLKTVLIEKEALGGVCLNWGCIPTKALLHVASTKVQIEHAKRMGLDVAIKGVELEKVVAYSRQAAGRLSQGVAGLLKKNKVTVMKGEAQFCDEKTLLISGEGKSEKVSASHIIIATGASTRKLPAHVVEADVKNIWTAREAMTPSFLPKKLLVIGAGAIGVEFASFYHTMGSQVTVVEMQDRILPMEDEEVSRYLEKILTKKGMTFLTKTSVEKIDSQQVMFKKEGKTFSEEGFDATIVAIGVVANAENLGSISLEKDKGHIVTNAWSETSVPGVYAIGDVAGAPWLAHKASHEAVKCVEKIAGHPTTPLEKDKVPGCTYCLPEVASMGKTEAQAKQEGYDIKVGRFFFQANGKAQATEKTDGFVKTIFDKKTGELLGAHMVGANVTEMIQGFCLSQKLEATELDIMETIFPHPTLSETMHEAVLNAYDQAIHI